MRDLRDRADFRASSDATAHPPAGSQSPSSGTAQKGVLEACASEAPLPRELFARPHDELQALEQAHQRRCECARNTGAEDMSALQGACSDEIGKQRAHPAQFLVRIDALRLKLAVERAGP